MIPGLELFPNHVSADHYVFPLTKLFGRAERRADKTNRSAVLRFGWSYEFPLKKLDAWPQWLETLREKLPHPCAAEHCAITLNEYRPGHAITPHIDSELFRENIQIVSVGAAAEMKFALGDATEEIKLVHGSVCVISGEARHKWTHEILPVPALRYSIVFRERT